MDILNASRKYVERLCSSIEGLKVLLLDHETAGILSCIVPQSYLLEQEIYLISYLENVERERLGHMRCLVFLYPSTSSIDMLAAELKNPLYSEYHVCFCSFLKNSHLERLAESDEFEVVKSIKEFYLSYYPMGPNLASLQTPHVHGQQINAWRPQALTKCVEGLLTLLLSLKTRPTIRYDNHSFMAQRLAMEMLEAINRHEGLFDFRSNGADSAPVLLILDRRFDLITPMLTPWTYQSLLHELFNIKNGRVSLPRQSGGLESTEAGETGEFVLCRETDAFYRDNAESTFGDLGDNVKSLVQLFQTRTAQHQEQLDSLPSMKRFIEEYPEYKKMSTYVAKHVALAGAISRLVENRHLMQLSEVEQTIATEEYNHQRSPKLLAEALNSNAFDADQKLRLCLLYALRYGRMLDFLSLADMMRRYGHLTDEDVSIVDFSLKLSQPDIVTGVGAGKGSLDASLTGSLSFSGLRGKGNLILSNRDHSNVYTRHNPPLLDMVDGLIRGRLSPSAFSCAPAQSGNLGRSQEVIVFIIGGTTYLEAHMLKKYNELIPGVSILLASSSILSTSTVVDDVRLLKERLST